MKFLLVMLNLFSGHSIQHHRLYSVCPEQMIFFIIFIICCIFNSNVHSQSIIYSISRISPDGPDSSGSLNHLSIITTTTTSSTFKNQQTNLVSITNDSRQAKIHLRSKRSFVPQRMPKGPKYNSQQHQQQMDRDRVRTNLDSSASSSDSKSNETNNEPKFGTKNISLVLAALLDHYDHNQRPGYGGPPAVITTNLEIRSMGPISELDMEYSLDCYFRQKWQDERLRFTGNANFLSLNIKMLDKIWKPDTYFHTGKASHLHMITTPNKFLRIFKNGLVLYSMRLTIKSLCPMDLHSFPMDKQSCPLILGSYGFPNDQLVYSWDVKPVTFNQKDFTLSQFDIVKTIYRNGTFRFKRGNHSMLQVNFNLRRHVGYFLIQIYVPCSLIVVLSWVSFWINREATSDRVGLGVTAVLTLSTFGLDSRSDLPRVSYATALDWYTVMCFLFVVFTLLEFAGVHYFTKVGTGEVPIIEIVDDWTKSSSSTDDDDDDNDDYNVGDDHHNDNDQKIPLPYRIQQNNNANNRVRKRKTSLMEKNKLQRQLSNRKTMIPKPPPMPQQLQKSILHVPSSVHHSKLNKMNNNYPLQQMMSHNQFSNFMDETQNNQIIQHMPYCPRYRHEQQQQQKQKLWLLEDYHLDYPSNFINSDLKLNSSWPTLSWNQIQNENNKLDNNDQLLLRPQHFSINHLPKMIPDELDSFSNEKTNLPLDNGQHRPSTDDDDDWTLDMNDSNGGGFTSWWIYRRFLYPVSDCCLQFWYCFTANEEYKKEMIKRRTKGQGMCAVNSVSMIDKVSRILFPLVFFILNMAYWTFYINERNSDFIQWEQ